MTEKMITITLSVPASSLDIDYTSTYEQEERHIKGGYEFDINSVEFNGHCIEDWDTEELDEYLLSKESV